MIDREAETSALGGAARERRSEIGGLPSLRADAGKQQDGLREQAPRLLDLARERRADDGADGREAALAEEILAPLAARAGNVLPQQRPVGEPQTSCTSAPPAFDVFTRQKSPAPSRRHAARNGSSASRPRYGLTVTASASGGASPRGSTNAAA